MPGPQRNLFAFFWGPSGFAGRNSAAMIHNAHIRRLLPSFPGELEISRHPGNYWRMFLTVPQPAANIKIATLAGVQLGDD